MTTGRIVHTLFKSTGVRSAGVYNNRCFKILGRSNCHGLLSYSRTDDRAFHFTISAR